MQRSESVHPSGTSDSLRPRGLQPARLLCPWDSPGKNTGVDRLLQGIFWPQGSNPGLLRCRQILYRLSHQGREIFAFLPQLPQMGRGFRNHQMRSLTSTSNLQKEQCSKGLWWRDDFRPLLSFDFLFASLATEVITANVSSLGSRDWTSRANKWQTNKKRQTNGKKKEKEESK